MSVRKARIVRRGAAPSAHGLQEKLKRRRELAELLNGMSVSFVSQTVDVFEDVVADALHRLADATRMDRVAMYRNLDEYGHSTQIYRWDRQSGGSTASPPEMRDIDYLGLLPELWAILKSGGCVSGPVSEMTEAGQRFLKSFGVKSAVVAPIIMHGAFWGFVSFQDHTAERRFDDETIETLYTAAFLCGGTRRNIEMVREIRETADTLARHDALSGALNRAAGAFLAGDGSFGETMDAGLAPIAEMTGVGRVSIFRNFFEDGDKRCGQVFRWENGRGVTEVQEDLTNLSYAGFAPSMEERMLSGHINSVMEDLSDGAKALLKAFDVKAVMIVPVLRGGAFWGFVMMQNLQEARRYDDVCTEALQSAALMCANAFLRHELEQDNAAQRKALSAQLERQQLLAELSRGLVSAGSAGRLVNRALFKLGRFLSASRIVIAEIDRAVGVGRVGYHWSAEGTPPMRHMTFDLQALAESSFRLNMPENAQQPPLVCRDVANAEDPRIRVLSDLDVGAFIWTGIYKEGELWGLMSIERTGEPEDWPDDAAEVASIASDAIGGAIMRDIYDKERSDALAYAVAAKQEAAEAEERTRAMLAAAPIGCVLTDENANVLDCNEEMLRILDEPDKARILNDYSAFSAEVQPDGRPSAGQMQRNVTRAMAGERVVTEWTYCTADGRERPCEITVTRIQYGEQAIIIGYNYDLRAIKHMQRELAYAEERARAMLAGAPIGCIILDEDANVLDCNEVAVDMFEAGGKQYLCVNFLEFSPKQQPDGTSTPRKLKDILGRAMAGERVVTEWMHQTKGGGEIPCEATVTRIQYGGRAMAIGYIYDMRGVKRMQREILERDAMLQLRLSQQSMLSDVSHSFLCGDDTTEMLDASLAAVGRFMGASRATVVVYNGYHGDAMLPYSWSSDVSIKLPAFLSDALIGLRAFPRDMPDAVPVLACEDASANPEFAPMGRFGVCAFIWRPLYVNNSLWGLLSIEQCDKPRAWTEDETLMVGMYGSFVSGVIIRDIQSKERDAALDRATVANQAKSSFLANMGHEMRTPMNAIIGMATIGKNAESHERKDYALSVVYDAATQLLDVINDILDMSDIETGKLELSHKQFSFRRMCERIVAVTSAKTAQKRQSFYPNIDADIPEWLIGDERRLSQVLTNLLSNAVKFTDEGGKICLSARAEAESDGVCTLRFDVADNGIGIAPEQQALVFQPFQQANAAAARTFGGTGLGLAISKRIVDLFGGGIWIDSKPGQGATFSFTVKLQRAE